jgi:hypothetical protein
MGRSPFGVAIGVSGDAQTHPVHPPGQVPSTGGAHVGLFVTTGPGMLQQSSPAVQQLSPQHVEVVEHVRFSQGGVPHLPISQYGGATLHVWPHIPQLWMSLFGLTHFPSQQMKVGMHSPQAASEPPPPPVPPEPAMPPEPAVPPDPPEPPDPALPPCPAEPPDPSVPPSPTDVMLPPHAIPRTKPKGRMNQSHFKRAVMSHLSPVDPRSVAQPNAGVWLRSWATLGRDSIVRRLE